MSRRRILLETTIQMHRLADDLQIRRAINEELNDADVYCTSFVLRELLRTIIASLAFVYTCVKKLGADGDGYLALERLVRLLAQGEGQFSPRSARREQYVVAAILERFGSTRIALSELLCYLEYVSRKWLRDFYRVPLASGGRFEIVGEFFLTGLDEKAAEMSDWIRNSDRIPGPPRFPSGASRFLDQRQEAVGAVHEAMAKCEARRRDDRLVLILTRLRTNKGEYDFMRRLKVNTRGNWCLGDLLIALETPSNVAIYTEDRHFEIICGVLPRGIHPGPRIRDIRAKLSQ